MSFMIPVDDELSMRLLEPEHAEQVFTAADGDREHLRQWLLWPDRTKDVDAVRNYAQQALKHFADRTQLALIIFENDQVVGGTGWTQWQRMNIAEHGAEAHTADIGYWLLSHAQGRGIMTRCVRKLLDVGFDHYGIHRLTIRAEPGNERSNALPRRLGFTLEGTMRHICRYDGRWVDHQLWSMLAEQWPTKEMDRGG